MRFTLATVLLTAAVLAVSGAPAAADTATSSNWAGYAVHRAGVGYTKVTGRWRQPSASCQPGSASFSSAWIGIGGFSTTSTALEQVGTEVDCGLSGRVISSAWYELVPAASQSINLTVRPGDLIQASVSVTGHKVVVALTDQTSHRSFTRTLHASDVDVSSAEWIVEAPSDCISLNLCQTLPLADFGSATFSSAGARSSKGHSGSISDRSWSYTRIYLTAGAPRFPVDAGGSGAGGSATPSALTAGGTAFTIRYSPIVEVDRASARGRVADVPIGQLVHAGSRSR